MNVFLFPSLQYLAKVGFFHWKVSTGPKMHLQHFLLMALLLMLVLLNPWENYHL